MKVDICLPIKNEATVLKENLLFLLNFLNQQNLGMNWKIIGAINGSSDDSEKICQELASLYPAQIEYFICQKKGKGAAIKEAWSKSQAEILMFMDADLAVSLSALPSLIKPLIFSQADLVLGSRFLRGAKADRSLLRAVVSKGYVILSQIILNHHFSDVQCGFKAINKKSFLRLEKFLEDDNWFLDTEMTTIAYLAKMRVVEIPVDWSEKRIKKDKSRIKIFSDSYHFIINLIKLKKRIKIIKKQL